MGQQEGSEVDIYSDELRPFVLVDDDKIDFTNHAKEVKVDPKEWELYSGYIKTLEDHKVWLVEEEKREAAEKIKREKEEEEALAKAMAMIAEMQRQAAEAEKGE